MTIKERIDKREIGIVGMARSGIAAALLAKRFGGKPFVSDAASEQKLSKALETLRNAGIPYETGAHTEQLLEMDYLVISPGVLLSLPILKAASEKGLPIFSELEFASWVCRGDIVAITGTNGKTTTTTLAGELFGASGRPTFTCGNIGLAFAEVADQVPPDGVAVVEVSSFQLEAIEEFHPKVAVILNITPDHLDRHGSMAAYKKAKYRITENQTGDDYFILNATDEETKRDQIATRAQRITFSMHDDPSAQVSAQGKQLWVRFGERREAIVACDEIGIQGPHNLQNAAAAVACTLPFGIPREALAGALRKFPGVEHRLEPVATVAGIRFINDSKATNVDSVVIALRAMTQPTYLILGGRDKGAPYAPLIEAGRGKVLGLIVIGEARDKIFRELGKSFPTQFASTLEDAVRLGFEQARPGETVLLSPGCASFDMFENFEHRGRVFKATVMTLKNGKGKHEAVNG